MLTAQERILVDRTREEERTYIREELLAAIAAQRSEWALAKPLGEDGIKTDRDIGADAAFASVLAALDRICPEGKEQAMLYEFTDRYGQSWAIEMPEGGVGVLRSPLNPEQPITAADALGSEVLRLAERAKDLETALATAGEARENTETRLSGRIAELEEEVRDLRAVLKTIFALNPEMGEAEDQGAENRVLRDRVTTLEQEAAHLEAENSRLRYADARLTSLRLEVDERGKRIAHLESLLKGHETNGRLAKAIIDQQATRIEALTAEVRSLGSDLAAAIRTGEEQAGKISEQKAMIANLRDELIKSFNENMELRSGAPEALRQENDRLRRALDEMVAKYDHDIAALEDCRREWLAWGTDAQKRLSRLDALLSSEAVPAGLRRDTPMIDDDAQLDLQTRGGYTFIHDAGGKYLFRLTVAEGKSLVDHLRGAYNSGLNTGIEAAWRWFREQLGAPADTKPTGT